MCCGVLIGVAAGIKLTPLIFVAHLLLTGRRRAAAVATTTAAATAVLGWILMPGPSHTYFLHLMFDDRRVGAPGFVGNQSLNGLWTRLMHGYAPARPFWDLSAVLVLVVGLWTARRVNARLGEPHGLAVAAVTGLLVSPISWSHHWVWFVVPALILAWEARRARSIGLAVVALAWSVPFYVGPFWLIAHRNYRAVPPVGWQRPLADSYTLVGLVALVALAVWVQTTSRGDPVHHDRTEVPERREEEPMAITDTGATLVVVPTLDEAANIEDLLQRVRSALPAADVLVVDDGSRDGTPELAEAVGSELGQIRVWRRTGPRGLGAAYRAGFTLGLAEGYGVVVQMDADLSHDPHELSALIQAVGAGADLAIGSRYVPGGATPGWPARRVRDVTSGYRAYRAGLLRAIDLGAVTSTGFGFQIDMTDRARRAGATIFEVPIVFRDRTAGRSKMSGGIMGEALVMVAGRALSRRFHPLPGPPRRPRPAMPAGPGPATPATTGAGR
jgi:dolichol-phosphate mannosyltransferase